MASSILKSESSIFSQVDVFPQNNEWYQITHGGFMCLPYNGFQTKIQNIVIRPISGNTQTYVGSAEIVSSDSPQTTLNGGSTRTFSFSDPMILTLTLPYTTGVESRGAKIRIVVSGEEMIFDIRQRFVPTETASGKYSTQIDYNQKRLVLRDIRRNNAVIWAQSWNTTPSVNNITTESQIGNFGVTLGIQEVNDETGVGFNIKWTWTNISASASVLPTSLGATPLGTGFIGDTGAEYDSGSTFWMASVGTSMGCSYGFTDSEIITREFVANKNAANSFLVNINPYNSHWYPTNKGLPGFFLDTIPELENTDYSTRFTNFLQWNWLDGIGRNMSCQMNILRLASSFHGGSGGWTETARWWNEHTNRAHEFQPGQSFIYYQHIRVKDLDTSSREEEMTSFLPYKRGFNSRYGLAKDRQITPPDYRGIISTEIALAEARGSSSRKPLTDIASISLLATTPTYFVYAGVLTSVGLQEPIFQVFHGDNYDSTHTLYTGEIPWTGSLSTWLTAALNDQAARGFTVGYWVSDGAGTIYIKTYDKTATTDKLKVIRGPSERGYNMPIEQNGWHELKTRFLDPAVNVYGFERVLFRQLTGIAWANANFPFNSISDVFSPTSIPNSANSLNVIQNFTSNYDSAVWWGNCAKIIPAFGSSAIHELSSSPDDITPEALEYERREIESALALGIRTLGMDAIGGGSSMPKQISPQSGREILRRLIRLRASYPQIQKWVVEGCRSDVYSLFEPQYVSTGARQFDNNQWRAGIYNELYWWLIGPHEKWCQINPFNTSDLSNSLTAEQLGTLLSGCWERYYVPHPSIYAYNYDDNMPQEPSVTDIEIGVTTGSITLVDPQNVESYTVTISKTSNFSDIIFKETYEGSGDSGFIVDDNLWDFTGETTYYAEIHIKNEYYETNDSKYYVEFDFSSANTDDGSDNDQEPSDEITLRIDGILDINLKKKQAGGRFWLSTGPTTNRPKE